MSFKHLGGRLVELGELCLKFNQEFLPRPNDGAGGVEQLVIEQFAVIPCSLDRRVGAAQEFRQLVADWPSRLNAGR